MSKFGPLILSLILCSLNQAASEVYYITTDSTNLCIVQSCLTLSQFAANSSDYLCPNTTLVFLPGTHHLSSVTLSLSNVDNFVMKSKISMAQIHCTNSAPSMHFDQLQYIHITNLEFIGCGGNHVKHVSEFVLQDTKFEGQVNSGTALELIETTALIVNSTFVSTKKVIDHCIITSFGTFTAAAGGAITATNSTVDISQSVFEDNGAGCGGAISAEQSIINVSGNVFINNNASFYGGVLFSFSSTITIKASMFYANSAGEAGGVMFFYSSNITIGTSEFHDNGAPNGGVHSSYISDITIEASKFYNNSATVGGVLISIDNSTVTIEKSEFHNNNASVGGVLSAAISTITIETSKFHNNSANSAGGVLYSIISTTITIGSSNFTKNRSPVGAVIYGTDNFKIQLHSSLLFDNNLADRSAVIYLSDSEFTGQGSENFTFSNNLGSLVAFNSNVTLIGYARFMNNHPPQTASGDFQEGGAITLFQSNIFFDIVGNIEHNSAEYGGAIHSTESKLYVNGNVSIAHNTATRNGGGVYLATSELNCQQMSTFVLFNNTAVHRGGGLHATSSSIKAISTFAINYYFQSPYIDNNQYLGTTIVFISNRAVKGGGLSLEANAKLYVLKYNDREISTTIFFIANSADYGGAVYVDDDTNPGTCASDTETECLFQVLALYNMQYLQSEVIMTQIIVYFSQNNANISGSILYGGLLDRCAVSQFAEFYLKHSISNKGRGYGISYVLYYSHYELHNEVLPNTLLISSLPVQVCICNSNEPNCNSESYTEVKKGEIFTLSVVAVDQVDQPVSATIQTSLHFTESGLAEGQLSRKIPAECTNLTFNVVSPQDSENLSLYASDGPCKDADLSMATVEIIFLPCSCPIGLQVTEMNNTNCTCEYHSDIGRYMEKCDSHTGSLVKQPQSRAWISYINDTDLSGYLVYPNCPFDYCLSTNPLFYLIQPNGADAQCAFNRSSLLCGSCKLGLSLSLGSSRCLQCPSYWPSLLVAVTIAAILAGIALVALLLVFNMTVAVGTLNGLILYANIVYVNKSILLPFQGTNFITVFISWLNLDLGIDTCYFPGMDAYIKTWLQLAFPAYVFLLVYLVIFSSKSTKFARQIRKKDPVATLAMLILLSYAKLIEICFKSLSFGILAYPDGNNVSLWLPDATVKYLSVKHIPLFITGVLILLVSLIFPTLLFSWQFLLRLPKGRISKLTENVRIKSFIEYYHTPYTAEHRYWTGLLLIVRIILYLVAAVNVSNKPTLTLTAIIVTVCCIFALRLFFGSRLYRKWPLDVLETFFCLHILLFATFMWYSLNNPYSNKEAAAYTSVTITIVVLLLTIVYHVYAYTSLFSKIQKTKRDDPLNADNHDTAPLLRPISVEPTFSIVELPKPCDLAAPDPEEVANIKHTPGTEAVHKNDVEMKEVNAL